MPGMIIGRSLKMQEAYDLVRKVSGTSSSVLISGETGTGKELIAREIHALGDRKNRPFAAINCGAIPHGLAESELFGHEKGAFTGACSRKIGKFEYADGGTIFLDEIAALPMYMQAKLLRALQERRIERIGGNAAVRFDVRLMAATNECLENAIKKGVFREDLYYRLKVVPINLPALRERAEDIPLLAAHFMKKISAKYNKKLKGISAEAVGLLMDYRWPGNVRELENLIEMMVVVLKEGAEITARDIARELSDQKQDCAGEGRTETFKEASERFEREYITRVLEMTSWNMGKAAGLMEVHRNTLLNKIKRLGIGEKKGPLGDAALDADGKDSVRKKARVTESAVLSTEERAMLTSGWRKH